MKVREVTDADLAFGNIEGIIPPYEKIPEKFRVNLSAEAKPCVQLFSDWFYTGLAKIEVIPRPGVDSQKAVRMIRCVMGSWAPKHEHKTAAVAYMIHEFFVRVEYATKSAPEKIIVVENR